MEPLARDRDGNLQMPDTGQPVSPVDEAAESVKRLVGPFSVAPSLDHQAAYPERAGPIQFNEIEWYLETGEKPAASR